MMPERFDHFMARANAAYYANRDPFMDFATAPEMTQVFGEIIGAWARVVWQLMGEPGDFILAEAGPGRGLLMADARRTFGKVQVHFIEQSERLHEEQAKLVPTATWHESLADVPDRPMILIANEFLDALPVRQFIRREDGWMERFVADESYVEQPADFPLPDDAIGSVREINEPALQFITDIARRNAIGLFIDYGPLESRPGSSVQAIKNGHYAHTLQEPGTADITAHVDFTALAQAAQAAGADVQGPVKQNAFLTALGLMQRTDMLARQSPALAENLRLAALRLTAPEAMGSLFKVMAVCPRGFPTLPGFEA